MMFDPQVERDLYEHEQQWERAGLEELRREAIQDLLDRIGALKQAAGALLTAAEEYNHSWSVPQFLEDEPAVAHLRRMLAETERAATTYPCAYCGEICQAEALDWLDNGTTLPPCTGCGQATMLTFKAAK